MNPWGWLLILLIMAFFIPRYGLLARYKEWRSAREREQLEDALKHLLDREAQRDTLRPNHLPGP